MRWGPRSKTRLGGGDKYPPSGRGRRSPCRKTRALRLPGVGAEKSWRKRVIVSAAARPPPPRSPGTRASENTALPGSSRHLSQLRASR